MLQTTHTAELDYHPGCDHHGKSHSDKLRNRILAKTVSTEDGSKAALGTGMAGNKGLEIT